VTDRLYAYTLTVPAGTLNTSPATLSIPLPALPLDVFRVRVPPGPHGNVGFQIWYGGGQVFPFKSGSWMIADDAVLEVPPEDNLDSGSWQIRAYNSGVYDHTLYVEIEVRVPSAMNAGSANVVTPIAV